MSLLYSYHELLFMIDTCQANTMYSHLYSPNLIASGSSALGQSSYSHHADNDVGVAVIDRYTYYNLEFLENNVRDPNSPVTLGELFDSWDPEKIHSEPGIRFDLFPGGEQGARSRRVVDFFGNVKSVEVGEGGADAAASHNESEWLAELEKIGEMIEEAKRRHNASLHTAPQHASVIEEVMHAEVKRNAKKDTAVRVDEEMEWSKKIVGAAALLGCVGVWVAGSVLESL